MTIYNQDHALPGSDDKQMCAWATARRDGLVDRITIYNGELSSFAQRRLRPRPWSSLRKGTYEDGEEEAGQRQKKAPRRAPDRVAEIRCLFSSSNHYHQVLAGPTGLQIEDGKRRFLGTKANVARRTRRNYKKETQKKNAEKTSAGASSHAGGQCHSRGPSEDAARIPGPPTQHVAVSKINMATAA
ncbi:hypothetical protein HPB51_014793 [Rhipicephalus microplus]|uniref:Uncharacterized protein n=1 Tax=Rhipicephalus microplus TaxID=6941 RepID=A0A9J6DNR7_RHIMP|nr:hypothetical protein HPB51_014793 [Rhipicephalus microplus]